MNLDKIFELIQQKTGTKTPLIYKLVHNIPLSKEELIIDGNLYLRNTKITELPYNLTVNGSLDLRDTKITELPDNLTVGRDLDLSNTNITKLPDNLVVHGSLELDILKLTEPPKNIKIGSHLMITNPKSEVPYSDEELKWMFNLKSIRYIVYLKD